LGARYDDLTDCRFGWHDATGRQSVYLSTNGLSGGRAPISFFVIIARRSDHFDLALSLHLHGDHDTEVMEDAARARRIPLRTLKVDMPEGRALYECDLALIRPDQHVAWRGCTLPADCNELLARVTLARPLQLVRCRVADCSGDGAS
jgi:hypothetical protein